MSDSASHADATAVGPTPEPVPEVAPDTLPEMASEPEQQEPADAEQQEPADAEQQEPVEAEQQEPGEANEPVPQPMAGEPAEAAPRAEVTVRQLCAEFLDCGMEAHDEFKNRGFRLTGIVDAIIIKDIVGRYQLALTDSEPHPLGSVFCTFEKKDAPLLARVEVGRQVTVDGIYFGFTSNIVLTGCSMVS